MWSGQHLEHNAQRHEAPTRSTSHLTRSPSNFFSLTQYLKPNHVERAGELNATSLYWLGQVTGGPEICKEGEILKQPDGEEVAAGDFYINLKYFEFVFVTAGNGRRSIKSLAMGCQT